MPTQDLATDFLDRVRRLHFAYGTHPKVFYPAEPTHRQCRALGNGSGMTVHPEAAATDLARGYATHIFVDDQARHRKNTRCEGIVHLGRPRLTGEGTLHVHVQSRPSPPYWGAGDPSPAPTTIWAGDTDDANEAAQLLYDHFRACLVAKELP